eukprot:ANDGO_06509.mRNA.1 hypothetical protein
MAPFTDDELRLLPSKIADTVQKMLEEEFKKAVQKLKGCSAICNIGVVMAAGKVAKAVKDLKPQLTKLKDGATHGEESDLGKAVTFPADLIAGIGKAVAETFGALKEFFAKAKEVIPDETRALVTEIGEVLDEFVKLLSGGGFVCGVPDVTKLTSLDKLVPEAIKNAPSKIFKFFMKLSDGAIAKFGVIGLMFSALVKTADVVAEGGIELFKEKFASEDEDLSGAAILALTKIGLTDEKSVDAVEDIFKNAAMDSTKPAAVKAKAAAALTVIATANAAKKAGQMISNVMDKLPSISMPF